MKYYEKVPENFLLIRFVATRYCNYRCPYCYLTSEKRSVKKTMFSHNSKDKWIQAIKKNFNNRNIELYFTGGEPLIIDDCILMIKELVEWENVSSIRIDSNLSNIKYFLNNVNSEKIHFLSAFHPTQVTLNKYLDYINIANNDGLIDIVNLVASKENLEILDSSPHELIKRFEEIGLFLNVAKDFYSGFSKGWEWDYEPNYKRYIDMLQYPLDNDYMNKFSLNKGFLCGGGGRHYITVNRHGEVFSCGSQKARKEGYGNIFENSLKLPNTLTICEEDCCPSIISYSFSCSNEFSPVNHAEDYIQRCRKIREGISKDYLDLLWKKIDINNIIIKKRKNYFLEKIKRYKKKILS